MLGPATVAIDSRVLLSFWPFGDVEGHCGGARARHLPSSAIFHHSTIGSLTASALSSLKIFI